MQAAGDAASATWVRSRSSSIRSAVCVVAAAGSGVPDVVAAQTPAPPAESRPIANPSMRAKAEKTIAFEAMARVIDIAHPRP